MQFSIRDPRRPCQLAVTATDIGERARDRRSRLAAVSTLQCLFPKYAVSSVLASHAQRRSSPFLIGCYALAVQLVATVLLAWLGPLWLWLATLLAERGILLVKIFRCEAILCRPLAWMKELTELMFATKRLRILVRTS